jgi:hypothetical protein
MQHELWPWAMLAGLGAFHGINPAMGWLFAVALGLQRRSRAALAWALLPIALGHALSIVAVVAIVGVLRLVIEIKWLQITAAVLLCAMAAYRAFRKHTTRVGMQVGFRDLTVWSFVMATGHGAGLMLIPVLLELPIGSSHAEHLHSAALQAFAPSLATALAAAVVHTVALLMSAGLVALVVYEWVGVAFLRRGWINFDLVWSFALVAAGVILAASALLRGSL